jgi:acetolactate synthase-1/2/3 large subunit
MNGAQSLLSTLVDEGVTVCFANPGTSEMHFVAALDAVPSMRGVLVLFEGVATGAADGYGRVTGTPAAALLHLGPGQGNGLANLHNARRARTPLINIVGDHATTHLRFDAPLTSDIASVAETFSLFTRTSISPNDVAGDARDAVEAATGGPTGVATLVVPADVSWGDVTGPSTTTIVRPEAQVPSDATLREVADQLASATKPIILVGGAAARAIPLADAARIADATGATVLLETFPPITTRGAGSPVVDRLSYLGEFAALQLEGCDLLVLAGAAAPASFFAYPGAASSLTPPEAAVVALCDASSDAATTLALLASLTGAADAPAALHEASVPEVPTGPLTAATMAAAVAATLPEGVTIVDESNTGGIHLAGALAGAPSHDVLTLTGGAIGYGLPAALGASIGRPDGRILCLEADGSALYTIQALWTMAREQLDVTIVILSNRSYAILNLELARVGAVVEGSAAATMLDIGSPDLDFVAMAKGLGVTGVRVDTAEGLAAALVSSYATPGPTLIEAVLPKGLG